MFEPTSYAEIDWDENGQPLSRQFGDVYFSKENGLDETRHVFLQANDLAERWQNLETDFVIGETGFGTGLNFLATWQLWNQLCPAHSFPYQQLHYIAVEQYPLRRQDLKRALRLWPELNNLAQAFIDSYPNTLVKGFHRILLGNGRVRLTLIINDAVTGCTSSMPAIIPTFNAQTLTALTPGFLTASHPRKIQLCGKAHCWRPSLASAPSMQR